MKIYTDYSVKPYNYAQIDSCLSRSAQPDMRGLFWLKKNNVSDIINFRTMVEPQIDFDEANTVKLMDIKYHNIPTITTRPEEKSVLKFLNIMENIKEKNGKAHIHCKAGADRTGLYAFIYKSVHHIGTMEDNVQEWINLGHNNKLFPNLIPWAKKFVKEFKKCV